MNAKVKNLSTYLTILIIPCVVGIFAYNIIINELIDDVYKIQTNTLKGIIKELDTEINSVYDIILNINNNNKVNSFAKLSNQDQVKNLREAIYVRDEISAIPSKNILDTVIFFKKSNMVISTNYVTTTEEFYNNYYSKNFMTFEDFYNSICDYEIIVKNSKGQIYKYNDKNIKVVSFIKSINKDINIMVLLDVNEIERNFNTISYNTDKYVVKDSKNNLIFNNYEESNESSLLNNISKRGSYIKEVNGEKVIITNEISELNSWNYSLIQSYSQVLDRVSNIKALIIRYVIVYLIIGIILSLYWSKKNQLRFNKIISIIIENTSHIDSINNKEVGNVDVSKIQKYMQEFNKNSKLIQENSIRQKDILSNLILNKLLNGTFNTNEEIDKNIRVLESNNFYKANKFTVCIIKGKLLEEENNKIILKELLNKLNNDNFKVCDSDDNSIIIIAYSIDKSNKNNIIKLSEILIKSYNTSKEEIFIGIGSEYVGKLDIYKSYQQAYAAIESELMKNSISNSLCIYCSDKENRKGLFYPIEIELRLINCTKLGLKEEVNNIINEIFDENFYNTTINIINIRALMFELYATLIRIINEIDKGSIGTEILNEIENLYEILYKEPPNKLIIRISEIYYQLCDEILKGKKKIDDILSGNIIDFIKCEFANPNLTIAEIADEFSISSGHVAKIVKECTGETFFVYLENIRMENAQVLIDTTDLPIYAIAEKSGYQLSATFCRAYKRRYNISPNKSREINRKNIKI